MTFNFGFLEKENTNSASRRRKTVTIETLPAKVELLNRQISLTSDLAIIEAIHKTCIEKRKMTVASYNVHSFNLSMQIPWFYEFQQSADITLCDGFGILKALNYFGLEIPIQYRIAATDLIPELVEYCNHHHLSIFLLGTKPEILAQAIQSLSKQYPSLEVFGHHGYFDQTDLEQNQIVVNQINLVRPNILIVGMGMPLQEQWLLEYRPYLNVNVFIPCGAVIDRLAGIVTPCPKWITNAGFEWLHRLIHEPKRLATRYLIGNPAFLFHIALAKSLGLSAFNQQKIVSQKSQSPPKCKIAGLPLITIKVF